MDTSRGVILVAAMSLPIMMSPASPVNANPHTPCRSMFHVRFIIPLPPCRSTFYVRFIIPLPPCRSTFHVRFIIPSRSTGTTPRCDIPAGTRPMG
ncbi:MAG: hypothetical protein JRJ29_09725 [Deltaproteobacteria bacterium]|nr:hypothetical protein [Deltaproteobacteria bacterium]